MRDYLNRGFGTHEELSLYRRQNPLTELMPSDQKTVHDNGRVWLRLSN